MYRVSIELYKHALPPSNKDRCTVKKSEKFDILVKISLQGNTIQNLFLKEKKSVLTIYRICFTL